MSEALRPNHCEGWHEHGKLRTWRTRSWGHARSLPYATAAAYLDWVWAWAPPVGRRAPNHRASDGLNLLGLLSTGCAARCSTHPRAVRPLKSRAVLSSPH